MSRITKVFTGSRCFVSDIINEAENYLNEQKNLRDNDYYTNENITVIVEIIDENKE